LANLSFSRLPTFSPKSELDVLKACAAEGEVRVANQIVDEVVAAETEASLPHQRPQFHPRRNHSQSERSVSAIRKTKLRPILAFAPMPIWTMSQRAAMRLNKCVAIALTISHDRSGLLLP
jgi:hypothetical protein